MISSINFWQFLWYLIVILLDDDPVLSPRRCCQSRVARRELGVAIIGQAVFRPNRPPRVWVGTPDQPFHPGVEFF
jgi:hypothetical protein